MGDDDEDTKPYKRDGWVIAAIVVQWIVLGGGFIWWAKGVDSNIDRNTDRLIAIETRQSQVNMMGERLAKIEAVTERVERLVDKLERRVDSKEGASNGRGY